MSATVAGIGGRWAFGVVILVHVIVYNETGGTTVVLAAALATGCAMLSAHCQQSLAHVQLPYMRVTHRFDFFCQFIALWMDVLALLATCAALARTLSTCMDAMSGGMARIYLLGRNSPDNEPWPDVLGVSVVFLLTVMFMLGLENTRVFGVLMTVGVVGLSVVLVILGAMRGSADVWKADALLPQGGAGLLTSAALCTIAFPSAARGGGGGVGPATGGVYRRCLGVVHLLLVGVSIVFTAGCLSVITQVSDQPQPYIAVPLLPLLEKLDFHRLQPAVVCLLVLACSGAYLELFPAMYELIVRLTTADWKILPRQIGYESADSGSPVLAIFTGASLCAMLAFACPLQNLVYILAGAHLTGGLVRAAYLLYAPLRPKFMVMSSNDATLAYSRLDINAKPPQSSSSSHRHHHHHHHYHPSSASASATRSSSLWSFLRKPARSMSMLPTAAAATSKALAAKSKRLKGKRTGELEREWLLLGEPPQSPRLGTDTGDQCAESSCTATAGSATAAGAGHQSGQHFADMECIEVVHHDGDQRAVASEVGASAGSGTDSSSGSGSGSGSSSSTTDIDSIVDEYRQKVKVSTAGPMEQPVRLPTARSWRLALGLLTVLAAAALLAAVGAVRNELWLVGGGCASALALAGLPLALLPRYAYGPLAPGAWLCTTAVLWHTVLAAPALLGSWPAIAGWALAGCLLFVRCDRWCCACFEPGTGGGIAAAGFGLPSVAGMRVTRRRRLGRGVARRQSHSSLLLLQSNMSRTTAATSSSAAADGGFGGAGQMASIRIPCPPRGSMVAARIAGHR